jgi:hypothetical protein
MRSQIHTKKKKNSNIVQKMLRSGYVAAIMSGVAPWLRGGH